MANVWRNGRWEDDSGTGNVLIGGAPGPNGTWAGGVWQNPQGGQFNAAKNLWYNPNAPAVQPQASPSYAAQTNVFGAQQASLDSRVNVNQAQQAAQPYSWATLGAQQAVMPYRQASLNASRGTLQAKQATMPAQQGVLAARQGVLGAQGAQNAGQRGYIGQQQAEVETRAGEFGAEQAALGNVQDQTAVATAQRYRAAQDARDRTLGITPSVEINAAPGTVKLGEDIAPGVRAKLTTQFEDVQKANTVAQAKRGFELDRARLAVQMMGQNVQEAQLIAEQAGLTLDQAQLLVTQAQYGEEGAKLGEAQAGLGVDYAKLAEAGANLNVEGARLASDRMGLNVNQAELDAKLTDRAPDGREWYTDPYTGQREALLPFEKDQREFEYETQRTRQRIPTNYDTSQQTSQHRQQQAAQGDPLSTMSDAQIDNMLIDSLDPNFYPFRTHWEPQVLASKTRRLELLGYPPAAAAQKAREEIDMLKRIANEQKQGRASAGPSTPNVTINTNPGP